MLLELYGVTGAERDGLIRFNREARQPGWWHSFRDVLPNPYEVYIRLDSRRRLHPQLQAVVVPGLLQTADYTARSSGTGRWRWTMMRFRAVEVRLARQQILAREECRGPDAQAAPRPARHACQDQRAARAH